MPDKEKEPFVLLRVKFQHPRLRGNLVSRPRLLDKLNESLLSGVDREGNVFTHKLILISAPAGYGKTTALAQWFEQCSCPNSWLSLDVADNELNVFLTYFVAAVQKVYPDACPITSSLLETAQLPPFQYIVSTLANELTDLPGKLVLALDDFHRIEGEAVPKLITALLDHLPPQVCVVIATRQDPDLPLVRLRANGDMVELRTADLYFTPDEVHSFLKQTVPLHLSEETIRALGKQTEGWIAGLHLAAISIRAADSPEHFVQSFLASGHRYVMEYLVDEVLAVQSMQVQDFLLKTSVLDRFCASLCDEVLHQQNSQSILEEVDQANLFIVPLDLEGKWFRYHHLFQELLGNRLRIQVTAKEIGVLHARASNWFAANEFIEEAMTHALAGDDVKTAARLVETNYRQAINRNQWPRLRRWLVLLPDSAIEQRPGLLMVQAWLLHQDFKVAETAPVIENATNILEDNDLVRDLDLDEEERIYLLAEANGLRSQILYFLADFEYGIKFSELSMTHISPLFSYGHSGTWFYWGLHSHALGKGEEAADRLQQIIRSEPEASPFTRHLYLSLCYIYRSLADFPRLSPAGHAYLAAGKNANLPESVAFAHCHLGVLHYEWNELETARHHFEEAIKLRYFAHQLSYFASLQGLVLVLLAQNQLDDIQGILAAITEFTEQTENHLLLASGRSFQARLSLFQGDLDWAERESQAAYDGLQVEPMLLFEIPALTRAKVLVSRKTEDSLQEATTLLDELLNHAQTTHFIWRQIEILSLQALMLAAQERMVDALTLLKEAVILARPGWLVRTFVDLGPPLAELFRQLAAQDFASDYVSYVLKAFSSEFKTPSHAADPQSTLLKPLTERELEILALLGDRLTNQEIAQRLVISPKTVKRHASNIYQKLGVRGRRQAAEEARKLGIYLPD